jgi:UDP-glucose:(heptosyl)LPS alpha-1,3-glucosyltransferase
MKLGLVRRGYSATGGAEAYLLRLAAELARRGHELVLFSDVPWPDEALAAHALHITRAVIAAPSPRLFADGLEGARARHTLDFLFSLERVHACDLYRAGDGVHAAWLERRARFEPAWQPFLRRLNPKHRQLLALERQLYTGGARRIIANSQMVKREIAAHYGTPAKQIEVIYNGLPTPIVPADARRIVRAELGLADSDYVAIFVGSGWERKGLRFAVEAVRRTSGVTLLVAGRGKSRGLGTHERIRFLGPRNDVPRLLAAADVFLLPTLYDPFSNASLEALAAGLPVITTTANGFAEIITPGAEGDVVAQPGDVAALAAALEPWRDPLRRTEMRPRLAKLGARFSIEENVRQTLAVIERPPRSADSG